MDIPFVVFVLYTVVALTIGLVGIIMGIKKIAGSPFITVVAGILFLLQIIMIENIEVDYNFSYNTTYNNVTDTITETPFNPVPVDYAFNQYDIWVFSILLGLVFIFIGIMLQYQT